MRAVQPELNQTQAMQADFSFNSAKKRPPILFMLVKCLKKFINNFINM